MTDLFPTLPAPAIDATLNGTPESQQDQQPAIATSQLALVTTLGDGSPAIATGAGSSTATTGRNAHAVSLAADCDCSTVGPDSVACCLGQDARVKAEAGPIVATWHDGQRLRVLVGYPGEEVKPDTWYTAVNGRWQEVGPPHAFQ